MRNLDRYEKDIKELIDNNKVIAIDVINNQVIDCDELDGCNDCLLFNSSCQATSLLKWLLDEYKEPPVLDEVEKKYLESVFKPFKDNIIWVCKHYDKFNKCEEINFKTRFHNTESIDSLPYFDTGTMYRRMKQNKCYSLKELGLFLKK